MAKSDVNALYYSEIVEFQRLSFITRTTSGSGVFTSVSSGITYSYTSGTQELYTLLLAVIEDYLITAANWNDMETSITTAVVTANSVSENMLKAVGLGGLPYVNI